MNTASVKAASVRRSQVTMIQCARFLRGLIADYHTVVFGWLRADSRALWALENTSGNRRHICSIVARTSGPID